MKYPIKLYQKLRDIYSKYIDIGLPLRHPFLLAERKKLLSEAGTICKEPILELVPSYPEVATLEEACNKLSISKDFADFARLGLFPDTNGHPIKLYPHQFESLEEALINRRHIVATTGTGSGKTECFLLPLVADLIEESRNWTQQGKTPAIRGLILYPLNALAEDQMVRLRRSLNSTAALQWLQEHRGGEKITFGRYTGNTPGSGRRQSIDKIPPADWNTIKEEWRKAQAQAAMHPDKSDQYLYNTTAWDEFHQSELWHRYQMQNTPPDILITNFSMLNIMLMREAETSIFEQTRAWLESNPQHKFHLIVDELHSYRGTPGTEIAYLIRLLLSRLGLTPESPQVQFLASSASMNDKPATRQYLSGFFGLDIEDYEQKFALIQDEQNEITSPIAKTLDPKMVLDTVHFSKEAKKSFLATHQLSTHLSYHLRKEALTSEHLAKAIFDDGTQQDALDQLIALTAEDKTTSGAAKVKLRAHNFFRTINSLWACINPNCTAVDAAFRFEDRPIGKLYKRPNPTCDCGSVILELYLCRDCGEVYLHGYRHEEGGRSWLSLEKPSIVADMPTTLLYPNLLPERKSPWSGVYIDMNTGSFYGTPTHPNAMVLAPGTVVEEVNECPCCEVGRTNHSPITGHYTGSQQISQVLADALIREMREQETANKTPKLVLFSDSRQGAAKLAAGIELNHFRDMLRQIVLRVIEQGEAEKRVLQEFVDTPYQERSMDLKRAIQQFRETGQYPRELNAIQAYHDGTTLREQLPSSIFTTGSKALNQFGSIINAELLKLGINPGGPKPSLSRSEHWYKHYDWSIMPPVLNYEDAAANSAGQSILREANIEQLITMFAHSRRSLEALCQGYIRPIENYSASERANEFIWSFIRLLGENWRIAGYQIRYSANSVPRSARAYARRTDLFQFNGQRWEDQYDVLNWLADQEIIRATDRVELTGKGLQFIRARSGDPYYECSRCFTMHLHPSSQICINCQAPLSQSGILNQEMIDNDENYYIHLAKKATPFRLHCEELTGQTDLDDKKERQQNFQGIFAEPRYQLAQEIDLLSVTTTMEAGVDIGALSAIMMGNVPPQRFNYQQRIGRAGRRGHSLSVALTLAKGNSHDQIHYMQSHRMISSVPSDPYLDLRRPEISGRVINKEVLHQAYVDLGLNTIGNDTHGGFGTAEDWERNKSNISRWLAREKASISRIVNQISIGAGRTVPELEAITTYLQQNLVHQISEVVAASNRYPQENLGEKLASAGHFPMFGFPTRVRYLFTDRPSQLPPKEVISRNLDLAISTFAPGSTLVKDKKIYTSEGLVSFTRREGRIEETDGRGYLYDDLYRCTDAICQAVYQGTPERLSCPACGGMLKKITACSPAGFYSMRTPEDYTGQFHYRHQQTNTSLDPNSNLGNDKKIGNLLMRSNQLPKEGIVHQINDNEGKLFELFPQEHREKWSIRRSGKGTNCGNHYAFIATRHTGVLTLGIDERNDQINIDPIDNPYVPYAFLSWAYLIRKSVCELLEIETRELQTGYRIFQPRDKTTGPKAEIFLVETLDNGAGYCNFLNSEPGWPTAEIAFLQSLLPGVNGRIYQDVIMAQNHFEDCDKSCYDCIREYDNQADHGRLYWRLGIDIAHLAEMSSYEMPLNSAHWKHIVIRMAEKIQMKIGGYVRQVDTTCLISNGEKHYLLTHPLWSDNKVAAVRLAIDDINLGAVQCVQVVDAMGRTQF